MIRHHIAVACVLAAIVWASLGVARFPQNGLAPTPALAAAPATHVPMLRSAAFIGVSTLCGMAAVGFGRARRWRDDA